MQLRLAIVNLYTIRLNSEQEQEARNQEQFPKCYQHRQLSLQLLPSLKHSFPWLESCQHRVRQEYRQYQQVLNRLQMNKITLLLLISEMFASSESLATACMERPVFEKCKKLEARRKTPSVLQTSPPWKEGEIATTNF